MDFMLQVQLDYHEQTSCTLLVVIYEAIQQ